MTAKVSEKLADGGYDLPLSRVRHGLPSQKF